MKTKAKLAGTVLAISAAAVFAIAPAVALACGGKSGTCSSKNGCKSQNSCKSSCKSKSTTLQNNQADSKSN